jgi:branched-chain amino acid transport system substrate-binding protein
VQRKYLWRILGILTVGVFLVGVITSLAFADSPNLKKKRVVLGGLFSLTGSWSTLGRASQAAMEIAIEDVNTYLLGVNASFRLEGRVEDTQLVPALALEKTQLFAQQDIRLLLGPQSSAEVAAIRTFVDTHDLFLFSPSSTAGTLAIAGDRTFRFTPSDGPEGEAIAALMDEDGISAIVPLWRDDPGNNGLHDATQRSFMALGGVVLPGARYDATTQDFTAMVTDIAAQVTTAQARHGKDAVAVYLAAFDEATAIFARASQNATLAAVRWYGSDGTALSSVLLNDPVAAAFAKSVGYPNPLFGLEATATVKWQPIAQRIQQKTGNVPESFALGIYDAVWVIAKTLASHRGKVRVETFTQAFPHEASSFFGTTGWTVLNAAGDRQFGNFDFWAIREEDGTLQWKPVAHYNTASGDLRRNE